MEGKSTCENAIGPRRSFIRFGKPSLPSLRSVRRAMTHIMWLVNLAPEIQEVILFLSRVESGPNTVKEIGVRRIARVVD